MEDLPDLNDMALVNLDDLISEVAPPPPASVSLLAITPAVYVEEAFGTLHLAIAAAITSMGMTVHDVDTPQGLAKATRDGIVFRDLRLTAERLHKEAKAPVLELTRLLDGHLRDIKGTLEPYEQHYAQAVKAAKERAAAAERALVEAEQQRVALIEQRIAALRAMPGTALNQPATIVETLLIAAQETIIDDSYGEYIEKARQAKDFAVAALMQALASKQQAEADQAELERLRARMPPPTVLPEPEPVAPLEPLAVLLYVYCYLMGFGENGDGEQVLQQVRTVLTENGIGLPQSPTPLK